MSSIQTDTKPFFSVDHNEDPILFTLPGHGEKLDNCGNWFQIGHPYDYSHGASDWHIIKRQHSCHRFDCPVCYESWAAQEANAIAKRIQLFKDSKRISGRPIHVIVAPEIVELRTLGEYRAFRNQCYKIAKKSGLRGGVSVFHAFRMPNESESLRNGPHMHFIGFGWITWTKELSEKYHAIVKNKGTRKSVRDTVLYLLSHASRVELAKGILPYAEVSSPEKPNPKILLETWFGVLSYNKFHVEPDKHGEKMIYCPMCDQEYPQDFWNQIEFLDGDPPDEDQKNGGWTLPEEEISVGRPIGISDYDWEKFGY